MKMAPLALLLAQLTPHPTPGSSWEVLWALLIPIIAAVTAFATIFLLTLRGYWSKHVAPLIQDEVHKWYSDPKQKTTRDNERLLWINDWSEHREQIDTRSRERDTALRLWYENKEQRDAREKELLNLTRSPQVLAEQEAQIKRIIDNEIKRTDGLISREIETQVTQMEARLMSKLDEVALFLREDTLHKQQMIQRMAKLEGAIHALLPYRSSDSISALPQSTKPR